MNQEYNVNLWDCMWCSCHDQRWILTSEIYLNFRGSVMFSFWHKLLLCPVFQATFKFLVLQNQIGYNVFIFWKLTSSCLGSQFQKITLKQTNTQKNNNGVNHKSPLTTRNVYHCYQLRKCLAALCKVFASLMFSQVPVFKKEAAVFT